MIPLALLALVGCLAVDVWLTVRNSRGCDSGCGCGGAR